MQLQYKGFSATLQYSAATEGFYGEVRHADSVIAFQASELATAASAFYEAVDRYLQDNLCFSPPLPLHLI